MESFSSLTAYKTWSSLRDVLADLVCFAFLFLHSFFAFLFTLKTERKLFAIILYTYYLLVFKIVFSLKHPFLVTRSIITGYYCIITPLLLQAAKLPDNKEFTSLLQCAHLLAVKTSSAGHKQLFEIGSKCAVSAVNSPFIADPWLMTLMKNIGGYDYQILGVYTPISPSFGTPALN